MQNEREIILENRYDETIHNYCEKNKTMNKKVIYVIAVILMAIVVGIIGISAIESSMLSNEIKRRYINDAQNAYNKIEKNIQGGEYLEAVHEMEEYEEEFEKSDEYYLQLPEHLKAEKKFDAIKQQIAGELLQKSDKLYNELDANEDITYSADYENLVRLEKYLFVLTAKYDYLNIGLGDDSADKNELSEKLNNCRFTTGLVLYNHGEKGEGINILKSLKEDEALTAELSESIDVMLRRMLENSKAKGFKILSGSENIKVFESGRNFGWQCPYCGYYSRAVGTNSIMMELENHYAGETSTYSGMMVCAGAFKGGCKEMSSYTLNIEWE